MNRFRAFTLVELLVAVGITAVLAAVLLSLVTRTMSLWERSASALELENAATLILDRMVTDLESAYVGSTGAAEWIDLTGGEQETSELRLIVSAAGTGGDADDPNTLREVSYRRVAGASGGRLYRLEATAAESLNSGYVWQTWPADPAAEFLLADRVEGWNVQFYDSSRQEMAVVSVAAWPQLARIEVTLLSNDGAARLAAVAAGRSNEPREQILAETGRTFAQWVRMGGVPR